SERYLTDIPYKHISKSQYTAVHKYKVSSKIVSASWTPDGNYLALGQYDGHVSIRDRQGNEKSVIERHEPIWCLQWSPSNSEGQSTLAVGCWDQTLSFYQINGQQLWKDRHIGQDTGRTGPLVEVTFNYRV
ncbi:hypothetical protein BVRB_022480, partial [Beta vulgaris subsp. vulgaris]